MGVTMYRVCLSVNVLLIFLMTVKTFQERHKMIIQPRTQSCLFLDKLKTEYVVNIRYLVLSSKNGKQQDITMRLKDNTGRIISYQGQQKHGSYDYTVKSGSDLEICFDNRHELIDSKKLVWEFDILGDEDKEFVVAANHTMEEYMFQADIVQRSVKKIRMNLVRSKSLQWWFGMKTPKDTERLESIIAMIDSWSLAHSCLVVVVGLTQLFVLKRFFESAPTSTKLKTRI